MSTAIASLLPRFTGFFSRPWSVGRAFFVAAAIGALTPLLDEMLGRRFSFELVLYVFPVIGVMVLSLIYWRMERGQFPRDRAVMMSAVGAAVLFVLGVIGSGWCRSHHICMSGHMDHPPYPWWHYGFDVGWVLCLVMASLWTRLLRVSLCVTFSGFAAFLISFRFLFGSLGGLYKWLPL